MDLDELRLLADVAELGSFAAAARARGLDPSSVSRLVARAERRLGLRVFQRSTRHLALTEAGQGFIGRIAAVLDEFDRAHEEAAGRGGAPSGLLRLGTSVAFGQTCVVPLLGRFLERFPEISVELLMSDETVDLVRERIDLAIRLAPAIEGDLVCARLRRTRYRVCASPRHLAAAGAPGTPGELAGRACLRFALPDYRSRWLFRDGDGRTTEVPIGGRIVVTSALALRQAALAGLGPALLPDWLVDADIATGDLVDLFPGHAAAATSFDTAAWLVHPSRAFVPGKVRAAIDFLRQHIRAGDGAAPAG